MTGCSRPTVLEEIFGSFGLGMRKSRSSIRLRKGCPYDLDPDFDFDIEAPGPNDSLLTTACSGINPT